MYFYLIYRPPSGSIADFFFEFGPFVMESQVSCNPVVYLGDFNIWMNVPTDLKTIEMNKILESHNFQNLITQATHISGNLLDLILTSNNSNIIENILVEPYPTISDHAMIYFEIRLGSGGSTDKYIEFRNYKNINTSDFSDCLIENYRVFKQTENCTHGRAINSQHCVLCLVQFYREASSTYIAENIPIIKKKIICSDKSKNNWYHGNNNIYNAKKALRKAEKRLYIHKTPENMAEFARLRQAKCKLVDEIKEKYYRTEIEKCSSDSRELQNLLSKLTGKNLKSTVLPFCSDEATLAENFKTFFITKIENLNSTFSQYENSHSSHIPDFPLIGLNNFSIVNENDVLKMLQELNQTNCSNDPFNMKLLKQDDVAKKIINVFVDIINESFRSGVFPDSEKLAIVRPLLKAGKDKDELSSYRPLYNTSMLAKLLEHACLNQISDYLKNFEAIPKYQSAYRKNHSVESALCRIYNDLIIRKSSGKNTLLILLDLSSAFDTVDQAILLDDLSLLGIGGAVLDWFRSYLVGRKFKVEIGSTASQIGSMVTGIPQGTKLSPILFSIYTSELYYILTNMGYMCHFYADDTRIMMNIEIPAQAQQDFSKIMSAIDRWMASRKLKLNSDKTECILFDSNSNQNQSISHINLNDSTSITLSDQVRNLGFVFDSKLKMETQINKVKGKAIANLKNIAQISKYLDRNSRLKLVYGLVLSHIDFCNSLYAHLPNCLLRSLQTIINSATRLIVGLPMFSHEHITPHCIELHFLPIKARIIFKICLLTYKSLKFGQPAYLSELLSYNQTERLLRSSEDPKLVEPVIAQSNFSNRCFAFCAPRMYNGLPLDIRNAPSVLSFKSRLKTFLFTQAYDTNRLCIRANFMV